MKRYLIILVVAALVFAGCSVTEPVAKSNAYKGMYDEEPLTVLLMPPINRRQHQHQTPLQIS